MKDTIKYFNNINSFLESIKNKDERYLLFVASNTKLDFNLFKKTDNEIMAAIFPHIIYKNELFEEGLISIKIEENMNLHFIKDIENYKFEENIFRNTKSVITVLQGFNKFNEKFLSRLFENVNINTNIIGGAAGKIEEPYKSTLFNKEGFYENSAILLTLDEKINMSAKHGMECLKGPYLVTQSSDNMIEKIDYIDAFKIYKDVVEEDSGLKLDRDNFSDISNRYPIGIVKYKGDEIVREVLDYDEGKLSFSCEITKDSMINILKAKESCMISAVKDATKELKKDDYSCLLMFNCIGRRKFLENKFSLELDTVYSNSTTECVIGVTTFGEVANNGNRYINLLNKTCVIGGVCF